VNSRPEFVSGATSAGSLPGQVDYRLTRNAVLSQFHRGRLSRLDVCDAHPELLRVARTLGRPTDETCPVCESTPLVHVSYAFGRHLSPGGSHFADAGELAKLSRRAGEVACYVVEVCPTCSWNHLVRTFSVGPRRRATAGR
jgi:RNA polymerase subunit RPABC4/transcription elongation factor Spt4